MKRLQLQTPVRCKLAWVSMACALLLSCSIALALDPSLHVSQYAHKSWKVRDGFPKGAIFAIAQTPDGYLWLGTEFGLLRFDGVRTVPWEPSPARPTLSTHVASLLVAHDGSLWIGTIKGLARLKSNTPTEIPELAGLLVNALTEDQDGTVWAGGFAYTPPGKLCAIKGATVRCYGEDGRLGNGVLGLYAGHNGTLWAGVLDGFWRWRPGDPQFFPLTGEPNGIQSFAEEGDGTVYVPLAGQVGRFADVRLADAYAFPAAAGDAHGVRILRDRDGGYWIGTLTRGLVHSYQGNTEIFAQSDRLSGDMVSSLFEDREGSIWVGTTKGLDRFSAYSVATFSEDQGLWSSPDSSVVAARDGSIWFAPQSHLYRLHGGEVTLYQEPAVRSPPIPQELGRVRKISMKGLPNHDRAALFEAYEGRIWIAATGGVGYLEDDRFVSISGVPGGVIYAIAGDQSGNLWISNFDRGLLHLSHDRLVEAIPWATLARNDLATALAIAPTDGTVWLGFSKGGIAALIQGELRTSYTVTDGLGAGRVSELRFDGDGTLWVATDGGLSRVKDGKITTLSMKNDLPCERIFWSMEYQDHSFWLYSSCGLIRIDPSELDAWIAADVGTNHRLKRVTLFDRSDGVSFQEEFGSGPGPRPSISPDGRIWFPTFDGLSVVNPRHLELNPMPPPVRIERINADSRTYGTEHGLGLPPLMRDLAIEYTALSLVAPEKVLFRYKLEGHDRDWQEAGNRRQAFYSDLAPGNYRFRVIASNNSGVWNERGDVLDFSIAPAYWQTLWFRILCMAVAVAFLWMLYRLRVRTLAREFDLKAEARVDERTRIARELHDTLLQSFQGLLLRFQAVAKRLPEGSERQKLSGAIADASQAIGEGRNAIEHLRPPTAEKDLATALRGIGEELTGTSGEGPTPAFQVDVHGTPRTLHPLVRDEIYRIAREALRNAFQHAKAHRIEVVVRYDERRLVVSVRDDGRGIEPEVMARGARSGHFGLRGMHERSRILGAHLDVWTEFDLGTEVELSIAASVAYETSRSRARFSRLGWISWKKATRKN